MKDYYTTQKYIIQFLKQKMGTEDKFLSELNYKFITDLEIYLRQVEDKNSDQAMANNRVMKHIERFCKMINLAVKLEWLDRNPFHAYQLKFEKLEREYLNEWELANLEAKTMFIPRLQTIKGTNSIIIISVLIFLFLWGQMVMKQHDSVLGYSKLI